MFDPDDPKVQNEVAQRLMAYAAKLRRLNESNVSDAHQSEAAKRPRT